MYKKIYLILAHKNLSQVESLVQLLDDSKSIFFIHFDKKTKNNKLFIPNCHFIKNNVACQWGTFSLVQATINSFKEIELFMKIHFNKSKYHVIMLSGEDLPLQKNEEIHRYLEQNNSTSFINHWKLPHEKWWGGGLFRFESVFLFNFLKHRKSHYYFNKLIRIFGFSYLIPINQINKKYPNLVLFGSSQWMILSGQLIENILVNCEKNSFLIKGFKNSFAPDETFFATLIFNFCDEIDSIKNVATTFVCFSGHDSSPKYLEIAEIVTARAENYLFARKFDNYKNKLSIEHIIKYLS